jgi:hypothetical protein
MNGSGFYVPGSMFCSTLSNVRDGQVFDQSLYSGNKFKKQSFHVRELIWNLIQFVMKKLNFLLLFVLFNTGGWSQPLPVKLNHSVIIDTDCGIDDMRAISLMLARPEITIEAVTLSDGSLPPDESIEKVRSLLHEFNRDSIPVACGDLLPGINPSWRQFSRQINWGIKSGDEGKCLNAVDCLSEILSSTNEKIILVCLGPLTNIAHLISKAPSLLSQIERVIWYNESVKPLQGFNYECDKDNADMVFQSNVRMDIISNLKKEEALFDTSLYEVCKHSKTVLANVIYNVHSQPVVFEKLQQNHFRL